MGEPTAKEILEEIKKKNLSLKEAREYALSRSKEAREVQREVESKPIYVYKKTKRTTSRPEKEVSESAVERETAKALESQLGYTAPIKFEVDEVTTGKPREIPRTEREVVKTVSIGKLAGIDETKERKLNIFQKAKQYADVQVEQLRERASQTARSALDPSRTTEERIYGGVSGFVLGAVSVPIATVVQPVQTFKGTVAAFKDPVGSLTSLYEGIKTEPTKVAGEFVGGYKTFKKATDISLTGIKVAKTQVIKTRTYVEPKSIFSERALSDIELGAEKPYLPKVGSLKESLSEFKKSKTKTGEFEVVSASPERISGDIAGASRKGALGLEDPGIYVTPLGKGSPAFLRLKREGAYAPEKTEFTLNPLKPFVEAFKTPTATVFTVKDVTRIPKAVKEVAGFSAVETFFKETASKKGKAFITKRSELGLGATKRQGEFGTTELEAVVPLGTKFEYKKTKGTLGFEEYTIVGGEAVIVRRARTVPVNETSLVSKGKVIKTKGKTIEQISLEESASYKSAFGKKSYVTPTSAFRLPKSSRLYSKPSKPTSVISSKVSKISKPSKPSKPEYGPISKLASKISSQITSGFSRVSSKTSSLSSSSISSLSTQSSILGDTSLISPKSTFTLKPKSRKGSKKRKRTLPSLSSRKKVKYAPTVFAATFNVRGKESKLGTTSGLGIRPIK